MCMALVRDPHEKLANQRMKREGQGAKYFLTVDSEKKKKKKTSPTLAKPVQPLENDADLLKSPNTARLATKFQQEFWQEGRRAEV